MYSLTSILLCFFFTGNKIFNVQKFMFNEFYYPYSTSYAYTATMLLWLFFVFQGHFLLYRYYKKADKKEKNKTLYFFFGMIVGFSGGITNILPMIHVPVYPFGNITIPIYCAIATYAILRHNLTDIHIVVRKGLIYSFLAILITLLYFLLILISEKILQGIVGYQSFIISIPVSIIIAIFFIPLRNKIQIFVDRIFFKRTHEEIAQENELLRQEVSQTEKLKSVATLASGMAHEIKNPLTAIKTFCEFLPQKLEDKEFLKKFSRIVGNEVDHIDNIVHQLLEFAKPSPLAFKNIDIYNLIDNILEFLNNDFIKHKIKVTKEFREDDSKILIEADSNQLRQAFLNIFLNAIDAMKTGGNLLIKTKATSNALEIIIQDSGPGINRKDLKHIFDPFYTKKDRGTGLGLSIAQRIILEHKGIIFAESKNKVGTKFIIQLPIKSTN